MQTLVNGDYACMRVTESKWYIGTKPQILLTASVQIQYTHIALGRYRNIIKDMFIGTKMTTKKTRVHK